MISIFCIVEHIEIILIQVLHIFFSSWNMLKLFLFKSFIYFFHLHLLEGNFEIAKWPQMSSFLWVFDRKSF